MTDIGATIGTFIGMICFAAALSLNLPAFAAISLFCALILASDV